MLIGGGYRKGERLRRKRRTSEKRLEGEEKFRIRNNGENPGTAKREKGKGEKRVETDVPVHNELELKGMKKEYGKHACQVVPSKNEEWREKSKGNEIKNNRMKGEEGDELNGHKARGPTAKRSDEGVTKTG